MPAGPSTDRSVRLRRSRLLHPSGRVRRRCRPGRGRRSVRLRRSRLLHPSGRDHRRCPPGREDRSARLRPWRPPVRMPPGRPCLRQAPGLPACQALRSRRVGRERQCRVARWWSRAASRAWCGQCRSGRFRTQPRSGARGSVLPVNTTRVQGGAGTLHAAARARLAVDSTASNVPAISTTCRHPMPFGRESVFCLSLILRQ